MLFITFTCFLSLNMDGKQGTGIEWPEIVASKTVRNFTRKNCTTTDDDDDDDEVKVEICAARFYTRSTHLNLLHLFHYVLTSIF